MKMSLATAGVKTGLDKAKAGVKDFSTNAKAKLEGLKNSFSGISGILTGAVVGGFAAAAKSAMNYAKEITTLSQISNTSIEDFQGLAFGAKKYGIEQEKLADIFKDVNDKVGDFLQAGSGPMVDFFENIAPAVGVTAEQFKNLSGPQALQLYYDSISKANLSQQEMTFYMEAIASDATALIPLLAEGGEGWKNYADEAARAGLILDTETAEQLRAAQLEIEKLGNTTTITAGKITAKLANFKGLRYYFGLAPGEAELMEKTIPYLVDQGIIQAQRYTTELSELTGGLADFTIGQIETETEARRKAAKERQKQIDGYAKTVDKIQGEREKRIKQQQTAEEALAAAEKKRIDAKKTFDEAMWGGSVNDILARQLAYEESLTEEATARKKVKEDLKKLDAEIGDLLKQSVEWSAKILKETAEQKKEEALVAEQVKLQSKLKEAIASGSLDAVKAAQEALDVEEQILRVINDTGVTRDQAVAHVTALRDEEKKLASEKAAEDAREEAQAEKMLGMERDLLDAVLSGDEMAARAAQKKIDLEQRAQQIMQDLKVDYEEAYEIAKKLAAIEAGPDLNDSGFTTRFEQREFERQQKEKQKILDQGLAAEERDQRERGGNIPNVTAERRDRGTVRERAAAAKELREQRKANQRINRERDPEVRKAMIEAEDKRRADVQEALKPKVGGPPLGPDGKPVLPGGNHVGPDGKMVGPNGEPLGPNGKPVPEGPKKPGGGKDPSLDKLDKIITELGSINKSLQC